MSEWFIFENRLSSGPFTDAELRKMLAEGRISPYVPARRGRSGAWRTLYEYPDCPQPDAGNAAPAPETAKESETPAREAHVLSCGGGEIRFACPGCAQHYSGAVRAYCGRSVSCQSCNLTFRVPVEEELASGQEPAHIPTLEDVDFTEDIPDGDIICPHCWKSFGSDHLLYIASHPSLVGDPVLGEFEQKRFAPTVFNAAGQPLDPCNLVSTDMACPRCHLRLPSCVIDLPSFYLSIVGAPSSGKSYYLTGLVHALRRSLPEDFAASFIDADPRLNAVLDGYERLIFMALDQNKVAMLPKTQQIGSEFSDQVLLGGVPTDLPKPFVFEYKSEDGAHDMNLVFYDNAGEHFQPGADVLVNPATQHLACSNGIIFLFDPTNDAIMRNFCDRNDPQVLENAKVSDQTVLLSEMINRIRRHCNMTAQERCAIPLVITVAKYDAWKEHFTKRPEALSPVLPDPDSAESKLDMNMLLDMSFALRELVFKHAPGLVNAAEAFFEQVYFVPESNFGSLARRDDSGALGIVPADMKPVWVEVPFLLLLTLSGILREGKSSRRICESNFQARVLDQSIVFKHPTTGRRVRLPLNYLGATLEIDGKYYALPPKPARADARRNKSAENFWQ